MTEEKKIRLSQAAKELNVGVSTITEHLAAQGVKKVTSNSKISRSQFEKIAAELGIEVVDKKGNPGLAVSGKEEKKEKEPEKKQEKEPEKVKIESEKVQGLKVLGKIDLNQSKPEKKQEKEVKTETKKEQKSTPKSKTDTTKKVTSKQTEVEVKPEKVEKKVVETEKEVKKEPEAKKEESKTSTPKQKEEASKKVEAEVKTEKAESPTEEKTEEQKPQELIKAKSETLKGLKVLGKIELPTEPKGAKKPVASSDDSMRKKRKRKKKVRPNDSGSGGQGQRRDSNNTSQNTQNKQGGNNSNNNSSDKKKEGGNNNSNNNQNSQRQRGNNRNQGGGQRQRRDRVRGNRRGGNNQNQNNKNEEISAQKVQEQLKATLAKMSGGKGGKRGTRKQLRERDKEAQQQEGREEPRVLKVTEFISVSDLASIMDISVNDVISTFMSAGMIVSINQRLDAEAIKLLAIEFDYDDVDFSTVEEDDKLEEEEVPDKEEDLEERAPIVTIMGHVDHGKTSLLDYVRNANVVASESGGITQHIGAYDAKTKDGKRIAFLDTPGHEAFTAMRARGAKVTDVVILVVAADDRVMPQTKEAINHAQVAGVPIVIAINKVDKPQAQPDKIREELSGEGILVESWGGKYQDQEISAKTGQGVDELLEKVLLEAELLELKANPDKKATGTVVEASLDKGRGYISTILVQAGTLKVGDILLAGQHFGKVKAMNDHRGKRVKQAIPSTPVQVLGLDGAPQAGDTIKVMDTDREAREIALKRAQILREQSIRATKGLTLEEIGRRRALGDFQELKIIVKGDVDGSVEALSDSLLKLSTEEIEVNIIHKAVGQITESDILLASASEAVVVGFQVRPSSNAKRIAENEQVQIKLYSIIYDAINEIRDAMEGMLSPEMKEEIVGNVEIRETFKISKIGTVAGCYVTDGLIKRNNPIRLIRDGIVKYEGEIGALKRFKDDVNEVKSGYECGLSIKNFNDIKVGDVVESYEIIELKRTL